MYIFNYAIYRYVGHLLTVVYKYFLLKNAHETLTDNSNLILRILTQKFWTDISRYFLYWIFFTMNNACITYKLPYIFLVNWNQESMKPLSIRYTVLTPVLYIIIHIDTCHLQVITSSQVKTFIDKIYRK